MIGFSIAAFAFAFSVFVMIRNNYVFDYRMKVLLDRRFSAAENLDRYDRLPSHYAMLWQLFTWKWDVETEDAVKAPF